MSLAQELDRNGTELWGTSGTATRLRVHGLQLHTTDELTGISSWFGGRVKTLHPAIFGGILAPRDPAGTREMEERGLHPFDLVAVQLYPFENALQRKPSPTDEELIELIDIGGVSLLRAAAKNFPWVVPVPSPQEAELVIRELREHGGAISMELVRRLTASTFQRTATYDAEICAWISRRSDLARPAPLLSVTRVESETLRYGENPQQAAWVYAGHEPDAGGLPWPLETIKGDALSYNNYLDIDNSVAIVARFSTPAAAVVKHATPCGVAVSEDSARALARALETDPVARYGCVIALNREVTESVTAALKGTFVDLIIAPGYTSEALESLRRRSKVKVILFRGDMREVLDRKRHEVRTAAGRMLYQESDQKRLDLTAVRQVSRRSATPAELSDMAFAWEVVRFVRSNAIVLARSSTTTGIGGGQTSRVGAVRDAIAVAGERARGSVLASDAFFPFRDGIDVAAAAGITAVLHPGGSIRDPEVITAADEHQMALYTTGWRVFRH